MRYKGGGYQKEVVYVKCASLYLATTRTFKYDEAGDLPPFFFTMVPAPSTATLYHS